MKKLLLITALFITFITNAQHISNLEGVWKNTDDSTTYLTIIAVDIDDSVTSVYNVSFDPEKTSEEKEFHEQILEQDYDYLISTHYIKRNDYAVTSKIISIDEFTMKRVIKGSVDVTIFYKKII
jgi:hypothetical protein|tara:strand:+ start:1943 stop:2314 length:372 start_codon:yes stop_codon:yes gene_type:complete